MAVRTFAAIVIGSTETEMRIYEYSAKKNMKQIDRMNTRINLGVDAYSRGRLDPEKVEQLCQVLKDFRTTMEGYRVDGCKVCATSALREIRSSDMTRDYIEKQTGLPIDILSNSEHRFLDYKSIASVNEAFAEIIRSGTAVVDIGGNSMQISFFDKDKLVTTQNLRMGKINTREAYMPYARNNRHFAALIGELLNHEMAGFSKLYQKEKPTNNLIVLDPDLSDVVRHLVDMQPDIGLAASSRACSVSSQHFGELYDRAIEMSPDDLSAYFEITADAAALVLQSVIFCRCLLESTGAQNLWLMDVSVCDGMAYNFGVENKLIRQTHNFEEDIIAASRQIAKRYKSGTVHTKNIEELCVEIFNKTRKIHGLKSRERVLLQISAILHNCGKYISLTNVSDCAYNIIMATEIIGLSHAERRIIANVVRYNNQHFKSFSEWEEPGMTREDYLIVAKLTAILRVANALDRSHEQKFAGCTVAVKEDKLVFTITGAQDVTLEKVTLAHRAEFFAEVFNLNPVIVQKKRMQ